ncbi:hypothetical protein HNR23_000409 [Nocardiopsis mwathae]|uniref:Peptidase M43 pregnancy-associated plasma-A domain-containing protein n=1 Tax=Nocardiopsis mwathae TaxID=1472723 RepID=A0A7W9YDY0_9ACTN|nr:zinc metalloprotease [Nocardiopsis mwathae]MBB6170349.1 hypothetical protein [Nocardiopsis mwathae]
MIRGEKARRSAPAAMWGGLLFGALALAGLILTGAARAGEPAGTPPRAPGPEVNADAACPPRTESAARTTGTEPRGHAHLTPEEAAALDRQLNDALITQRAPTVGHRKTVPTVVHVVSAGDGRGALTDDQVARQIQTMNKGFSGGYGPGADTGFRFDLRDVTRTVDDSWFEAFTQHESAIKQKLRRGGADTLNLYMVNLPEGMLGRSTFPQQYKASPQLDGVVVDYRTIPGGERKNFNLGFTATHETGHWLGLFHTFQNGCRYPGDYVRDTPYEREQAVGCPHGRDTCPQPGRDPIHNFMNYSNDPCMTHFTHGQAQRMTDHWRAFRAL